MNEQVRVLRSSMAADVVIRRVRPSDQPELANFYDGLSPDSRRDRFLGCVGAVGAQMARSFCTPDHLHAEGFVARLPEPAEGEGEGRLVGHLCLEPAGPRCLELALAVADDWQGRGIGRALVATAVEWASEHGCEQIVASAFTTNSRVLRLLRALPHGARMTPADGGVVDIVAPLVAEMPRDRTVPVGRLCRRRRGSAQVRPRCHAVWRRRPPPVRDAAD